MFTVALFIAFSSKTKTAFQKRLYLAKMRNVFVSASLVAFITNAVIIAILRQDSRFSDRGFMCVQVRLPM